MRTAFLLIAAGLICVIAFSVYVRLAPSEVSRWNVIPDGLVEGTGEGSAVRVIEAGPDTLARLDAIARATPRTQVLAGSVQDGMVTYVTRSAVMGFPDYTTIAQQGDRIILYARLRFGRSDMGVNAARLDSWLAALKN